MSARSTAARSTTVVPFEADPGFLNREMGFRRCYRRPNSFHGVSNLSCNCLRVEIPVEAQAKGSGALGTPERNHDCQRCDGIGRSKWVKFGSGGMTWIDCPRCDGSGELTANGAPAVRS